MHYTQSCGGFSLAPSEGERAGERGCSVLSIPGLVSKNLLRVRIHGPAPGDASSEQHYVPEAPKGSFKSVCQPDRSRRIMR